MFLQKEKFQVCSVVAVKGLFYQMDKLIDGSRWAWNGRNEWKHVVWRGRDLNSQISLGASRTNIPQIKNAVLTHPGLLSHAVHISMRLQSRRRSVTHSNWSSFDRQGGPDCCRCFWRPESPVQVHALRSSQQMPAMPARPPVLSRGSLPRACVSNLTSQAWEGVCVCVLMEATMLAELGGAAILFLYNHLLIISFHVTWLHLL